MTRSGRRPGADGIPRQPGASRAGDDARPEELRRELRAAEARGRALADASIDVVVVLDARGDVQGWSPAAVELFGVAEADAVGRPMRSFLSPRTLPAWEGAMAAACHGATVDGDGDGDAGTSPVRLQVGVRTADGRDHPVAASLAGWAAADGAAVVAVLRDVAARDEAVASLTRSTETMMAVVGVQHAIANATHDLAGMMQLVTEQALDLTGAAGAIIELLEGEELVFQATSGSATPHVGVRERLVGTLAGLCVRTGDVLYSADTELDDRVDRELCRQIGARSMAVVPLRRPGAVVGVLKVVWPEASAFDPAEVGALELMAGFIGTAVHKAAEFDAKALRDSLTGLPNRALLHDRLRHALDRARRRRAPVGVLFLDLDEFKSVNDTLGHEAGDRCLTAVARRLEREVRADDTVARLAGDEFVVLCEDLAGEPQARELAERVRTAIATTPVRYDGGEITVSASIGVAMADIDTDTPHSLLRRADVAMYREKRAGRTT